MILSSRFFKIVLPIAVIAFIIACSAPKATVVEAPVKVEETLPAVDTEYYALVETPAVFNNGDINTFIVYLKKNIKYPASALKKKQQGTTVAQFGVDWNGKVNFFSVLKSSGSTTLDNEAVRAIKASPAWIPAKNKTQAVGQLFMLQIKFNGKTKKVEIK